MGRYSKRDIVLDAAENLFAVQGFTATGINQITEEAGVASMTLYNNFRNKNELVVATLERRSDRLLLKVKAGVDEVQQTPQKRILAVFDIVSSWISGELKKPVGFTGCMFLKAIHEYSSKESPERKMALRHKRSIIDIFERELKALGVVNFESTALSLQLLIDGAITQSQLLKDEKSAHRARVMAELILANVHEQ